MFSRWMFALVLLAAFPMTDAQAQTSCMGLTGGQVCVITATPVTMSTTSGVTYAWNIPSETTSQNLTIGFTCGTGTAGFIFTIKDETGTAGTYPISVTPAGSDTIDVNNNATTPFVLNANFESITFQCDGKPTLGVPGNWLVE